MLKVNSEAIAKRKLPFPEVQEYVLRVQKLKGFSQSKLRDMAKEADIPGLKGRQRMQASKADTVEALATGIYGPEQAGEPEQGSGGSGEGSEEAQGQGEGQGEGEQGGEGSEEGQEEGQGEGDGDQEQEQEEPPDMPDIEKLIRNISRDEHGKIEHPLQEIPEQGIDEGAVKALIEKHAPAVSGDVTVKILDKEIKLKKKAHKQFKILLSAVSNGLKVWMPGPAGSGKTTGGNMIAEALDLPFYCISVNGQTTKTELFGYMDANGNYVETLFYKAYKDGGVFLMDEVDAGNGNVLTACNAAVENGQAAFPCGMVKAHEDFRFVAAANTFGKGADRQYVGRNRLDAAFVDRFTFLSWDYDHDLERTFTDNKAWLEIVWKIRNNIFQHKEQDVMATPRATINGTKLLKLGINPKDVLEMVVFKGASEDVKSRCMNGVDLGTLKGKGK